MVEEAVLKTVNCNRFGGSIPSLSARLFGELAERYRTGLLSQGWGNTQVGSIPTLSALVAEAKLRQQCLLMNEFDSEEIVLSQYSSQTNGRIASR